MTIAYNENDPFAARWLRNLIDGGMLPPGEVITDSIVTLPCTRVFEKCREVHLFAGIGGWPWALWKAGWPASRRVWTGSCPCQPFSVAGKQEGTDDERHLWPAMRDLIEEYGPPEVFGEQVASPDGREWLAGVRTDLEELGYEVGTADLCAAGVGAPHIRQRLYWYARLGNSQSRRNGEEEESGCSRQGAAEGRQRLSGGSSSEGNGMGYAPSDRRLQRGSESNGGGIVGTGLEDHRLAHAALSEEERQRSQCYELSGSTTRFCNAGGSQGFWSDYDIVECREPDRNGGVEIKHRRIEPGTFPLDHGVPGRVGLLRGYGNAIVPDLAAIFVEECLALSGSAA